MGMGIGLVVVAAGSGTRMGGKVKKPYLELGGIPILARTLQVFTEINSITEKVVVVHKDEVNRTEALLKDYKIEGIRLVIGGKERQDSVFEGLKALSSRVEHVLIHDGARPFVSERLIRTIIDHVKAKDAVIPGIPVKDTIKMLDASGVVSHTPDRKSLWAVQTPQAFRMSILLDCYERIKDGMIQVTDDASLLEISGVPVYIVEGEQMNIKITTPDDLFLGEAMLRLLEERG
jgi:2-C-methyl-D-erythritol 4-phosphate cytidylyltransferase